VKFLDQVPPTPTPDIPISETPTNTPAGIPIHPTVPVDTPTPTPTSSESPVDVPAVSVNEIIISQGEGGQNIVIIRNFDKNSAIPQNAIIDRYQSSSSVLQDFIGGGSGRNTYVTAGDVNNDGKPDFIHTFGPISESAAFPNVLIPIDAITKLPIGHSFTAFPKGNSNPVQYDGGELRTAVGDFITDGENLLAVAQGFGSDRGLVRLFEFTGQPRPNSWRIVAQFQPLDNRPTQNNANGGVTLAAGDVDGDGKDELLAGQTSSDSSLTQFTVIDLDDPFNPVRHNFVGFPAGFRGQGGVELIVIDLNGDGINEIVASQKSIAGTSDTGNSLSVIRPVVVNQTITRFARPAGSIVKIIGDDSINPGGGLNIASGELDGDSTNGEEIADSGEVGQVFRWKAAGDSSGCQPPLNKSTTLKNYLLSFDASKARCNVRRAQPDWSCTGSLPQVSYHS